jgi:hypothetical protein
MRWTRALPALLVVLAAAGGCVTDQREWMKLNSRYTTEEFRRDRAACMKDGKLDEVCMRDRGWVAVNPMGKAETPKDPHARDLAPPSARGGGRY